MKTLNKKEELMRDYWLNSLDDNQLERLETEWFGSDEDAELLGIIRADLIGDYLAGDLSRIEKNLFEQNFLPNNLDDIILEKSSIELSRQSNGQKKFGFLERFSENLRSFGRMPKLAFAVSLLFLGLCAGLFIKFYDNNPQLTARNTESENTAGNFQNAANENDGQNSVNKTAVNSEAKPDTQQTVNPPEKTDTKITEPSNKPAPAVDEKPVGDENKIPSKPLKQQVLFLMITRGNAESLKISDSADRISLKLDMPGLEKAYDKYELRILDTGGNPVFKQLIKENLSLKKSGETITVPNIKTGNFKKNEKYKAVLVGIDQTGEEKQLSTYDTIEKN